MPEARKRPCSICRRWFRPDARIGARQRTCRNPNCQKARRRKKQQVWRANHPDYFNARRIQDRQKGDREPEPLQVGSPLNQLPWDIAQSEFGVQGADFLGVMGKVLLRPAQFEFRAHPPDSKQVDGTLPPPVAQSQIPSPAS